jgi:hypothetical protein
VRRVGVGAAFAIGCVLYPLAMLFVPLATGRHVAVLASLLGEAVGAIGAFQLVNYGVRPLGALAGGAAGATIGMRETLLLAVTGAVGSILWFLPSPVPRLRELPEEA